MNFLKNNTLKVLAQNIYTYHLYRAHHHPVIIYIVVVVYTFIIKKKNFKNNHLIAIRIFYKIPKRIFQSTKILNTTRNTSRSGSLQDYFKGHNNLT